MSHLMVAKMEQGKDFGMLRLVVVISVAQK
jgi:hypothetical protein